MSSKLTLNDYAQGAHRTTPVDLTDAKARYLACAATMRKKLKDLQRVADELDQLKKFIFYGKEPTIEVQSGAPLNTLHDHRIRALHATLGIASESGELAEALYDTMFLGKAFDVVNFAEEIGDVLWYCAEGELATAIPLGRTGEVNLAKLKKRFPEKFDENYAKDRDLAAEREVLETQKEPGDAAGNEGEHGQE